MQNTFLQLYTNNTIIQGNANLFLLALLVTITTAIIIGHERKHEKDYIHPWFGRYTVNIPNLMSYLRFPLGFWMFCVYYFPIFHSPFWHFTFHLAFAHVCLFDILDGKFARRWNAITEGGKSLDPAADKWVTFCLAITAYLFGKFYWWALVIIIFREIISIFQRWHLKRKGIDVSAKWLGKIKTGVQFTVLYIILLRTNLLPGTIGLDLIAKILPENLILWGIVLLCFCTVISIFPFFTSFSYVNDYVKSRKLRSKIQWSIECIPNLLTIGNYLSGITAVYFAMPQVNIQYRTFVILFWIFTAGLCDAFDGPLSRKLKSQSDFGACLDSSTDLSTFGLSIAVIIFLRFSAILDKFSIWGLILAIFYFTFVHLRLARFTLISNHRENKTQKGDFTGLPSPSGALGTLIFFTFFENIFILSIAIIFISLLMYSKFDFISHSNSIKHSFYRYFFIPIVFIGFGMLLVLIFQQPFVSMHFSRELIVYFKICSWILLSLFIIYVFDGIFRTFIKT